MVSFLLLSLLLLGTYILYTNKSTYTQGLEEPFVPNVCNTASLDQNISRDTEVYEIHCNPSKAPAVNYPAKMGAISEGIVKPPQCDEVFVTNEVYYPRYKFWWRWIKDLKTRPPYNRIFPPFWNTYYDPNITSDEYYKRVAADNIMPSGQNANQIKRAHNRNFNLRQMFNLNRNKV